MPAYLYRWTKRINYKAYLTSSTVSLGFAYYVNLFFSLLRGVIVSKVLKPEIFGIWSTVLIILSYVSYSHLGYFFTLVKDIPLIASREERRHHSSAMLGFSVIISFIVAALFFLYFYFVFKGNPLLRNGCLIISSSIIFETIIHFSYKYFRAVEDFKSLYRYTVFSSLFSFALVSFSVLKWHYPGLLISYTLSNLALMLFPFLFLKMDVALLRLDFALIRKRLYLALKYLLLDISGNTFRNLDKILILRLFSFHTLGIYSFFFRIMQPICIFFDAAIDVMFPRIVRIKNENARGAFAYLKNRLSLISFFFVLVLPFFIFAVLALVNMFLKEYSGGGNIVVYLPMLFYLYTYNNAIMVYLISSDNEIFINVISVVCIAIFLLASYFAADAQRAVTAIIFCNIGAAVFQLFSYSVRAFRSESLRPIALCLATMVLVFIISEFTYALFHKFAIYISGQLR